MAEIIVEERKTWKERLKEWSDETKWKVHNACEWCEKNKDTLIIVAPVLFGSIVEAVKIASKQRAVCEEKALKDRYIYDRSTGHYYELRRKPKTSEWLQIEQRKQNGESLGWILNDMRLLK